MRKSILAALALSLAVSASALTADPALPSAPPAPVASAPAPAPASGHWQGHVDLSPNVNAVMIRELHDGNWLSGIDKGDLWYLTAPGGREVIHAGVFQAWRTDKGDPTFGASLGVNAGSLGQWLDAINNVTNLPTYWKPAAIFVNALSVDVFTGWRPNPGPDVHAWTYGVGARLTIPLDTIAAKVKAGL